jgi:hypothetical protein
MLRNPNIHYRVRESPPMLSVLSHINSVHTTPYYFSKIIFIIILPHTSSRSQCFFLSFFLAFSPELCMHSSSSAWVLYALCISSSLTCSFQFFLAKGTSYEAPCNAVFSGLLLLYSSLVQIFFSTLCSHMAPVHVLPSMPDTKFHTQTKLYAKL